MSAMSRGRSGPRARLGGATASQGDPESGEQFFWLGRAPRSFARLSRRSSRHAACVLDATKLWIVPRTRRLQCDQARSCGAAKLPAMPRDQFRSGATSLRPGAAFRADCATPAGAHPNQRGRGMMNAKATNRREFFTSFFKPLRETSAPSVAVIEPPSPADSKPGAATVAIVQGRFCLAFQNSFCSTCVERCPVPGAISVERGLPRIDPAICTGCRICRKATCTCRTRRACPARRRSGCGGASHSVRSDFPATARSGLYQLLRR